MRMTNIQGARDTLRSHASDEKNEFNMISSWWLKNRSKYGNDRYMSKYKHLVTFLIFTSLKMWNIYGFSFIL